MEEEHGLSTVLGWEGCAEKYADVSEFTNYLGEKYPLSSKRFSVKWLFWSPEAYQKSPIIQNKIMTLVGEGYDIWHTGLSQFWAPKVVGKRCYLTTSDQPFGVDRLYKGMCWYRKNCMDDGDIFVDDGANEEQLGAVGRVFLNGHPESSPDLRLYSTNELPLRDYAARCGARDYLAVPVFDLLTNKCYGVLEYLGLYGWIGGACIHVQRSLLKAGLRTTHLKRDQTEFEESRNLIEGDQNECEESENLIEGDTEMTRYEIRKMLKAAEEMVPQLHMAQVWIPCKECANTTTDLCCMELSSSRQRSSIIEGDMNIYFEASEFHRLQLRKGMIAKTVMSSSNIKSCFCRNICDLSHSENPLAHYAQISRLSFCFAICLESLHNSDDLYYVEFFLQPNSRHDLRGVSLCHSLIGVMETNLKKFKVISSDMHEVRKDMTSNSIGFVPHESSGIPEGEMNILTKMNRGWEMYTSELEFQKYLQIDDHFSRFKSRKIFWRTWLFWCPEREKLCENDENYSLQNSTQEKIKCIMPNLMEFSISESNCGLVQFWEPEMDEERHYLTTSAQPFTLSGIHTGLAFLRKQSMKHQYFVDEGVKEEELGPIGRVFRSGHPEMTHDFLLYSTTEFPLKDDAAFCDHRSYIAFPVFNHQHKCHGVLEFVGTHDISEETLKEVKKAVQKAHLSSTHINNEPIFYEERARNEIEKGLHLLSKIPQLNAMEVRVPAKNCASTNNSLTCMRLVIALRIGVQFDLVETGKGIVGTVLTSENKCCYCKNSCQFSMTERSWPHYAQRERLDVCFAICLQSSYTGDLPFVLKFFLNQGPGHYEYLRSFLYYLLPILKQELKSFKVATGKQLGEELVVDIIEFSHEVNRPTSLQFGQSNMFPVKFQIVQYGQQEHEQYNDQQESEIDRVTSAVAEGNQCTTPVANLEEAEETSRRIEKGNMRTGLRITLEDLEGQFGKSREDAAKSLYVSISTLKRACRLHNIHRWPSNKTHRKNPSLYMTKDANAYDGHPQQSTGPPSSSLHLPLNENVPPTTTKGNQDLTVVPETDLVIIKAKHENRIVKFEFCLSSGLVNLCKEVATRLNLEMGSFELQYVDEDNDHISLTCDVDLKFYCAKVAGMNSIPVFVQLMG